MRFGAHIGTSGGLVEAVRQGRAIGCEAIQIFSKSPQMWAGPPVAPDAATAFREAVREDPAIATAIHHGYLINLGSPKAFMLRRSRTAFLDEIRRAELLGVDGLIFHPGAHLKSGTETGLRTIAESLRGALEKVPEGKVRLLLENAAGQGTALCSSLEELHTVLSAVDAPQRLGVTLDTCHLFAAGVDFRTEEGYGELRDQIERTIGKAAVRAFHLNDAKAGLGSHLDRHENIGKGEVGLAGFAPLIRDMIWKDVPGYIETPLDDRGYARYAEDLAALRSLVSSPGKGAAPPARRPPRSHRAAPPDP
ncbi:MAG: deoxyribonuclease IV [Thermoplasmata archaeon]